MPNEKQRPKPEHPKDDPHGKPRAYESNDEGDGEPKDPPPPPPGSGGGPTGG